MRFQAGNPGYGLRKKAAARERVPPVLKDMRWVYGHDEPKEGDSTAARRTCRLLLKQDPKGFLSKLVELEGKMLAAAEKGKKATEGGAAGRTGEKALGELEAFMREHGHVEGGEVAADGAQGGLEEGPDEAAEGDHGVSPGRGPGLPPGSGSGPATPG